MIFFITAIAITVFFGISHGLNAPVSLWHLVMIIFVPMIISVLFDLLTQRKCH